MSAESGVEIVTRAIGMCAEYDDPLGQWADIREIDDAGWLLVPPDRHIAWRARTGVDDPVAALRGAVASVLARQASARTHRGALPDAAPSRIRR